MAAGPRGSATTATLSLSPLQDRGRHSWVQGRTRFHAIATITAASGVLVVLGSLKQVWGAMEGTRAPFAGPAAAQPPAAGVPPGSGLEAAGDTAAFLRVRGSCWHPSVGAGSPAHLKPLSLVSLSQTQEGLAAGDIGVSPKPGGALFPRPNHGTPGPYARGAVCPPAAAVAARKCLHGDGRSRAQGWRNTSGSGWWGEGPSGEGAPEMGHGDGYSFSASGREAFEQLPRGSEALVATALRGRPGCGTRGDVAQSA